MSKPLRDEYLKLNVIVNGDASKKELGDLEKSTRDLNAANKSLIDQKRKLKAEGKQESEEYKKLSQEIKANNLTIKGNQIRMAELRKEIGVTGLTLKQLRAEQKRLKTLMDTSTYGTENWKRYRAELNKVEAQMRKVRGAGGKMKASLSNMADGMNKYAALGASVIATITGIVFSIKEWIQGNLGLSDSLADVMKTTGMTRKDVRLLYQEFKHLDTRTPRSELLKLAEEAGRLGKKSRKDVMQFVEVANKLSVALGDDLGGDKSKAIREVGKLVDIYKVGAEYGTDFGESMEKMGSGINEVSANSNTQADYLIGFLKRMGGVAVQAKVSGAEIIGYASTLDQLGQSQEMAATATGKVMVDMFKDHASYAKIAKMEDAEFVELLNKDANEAFIKFLSGLNGNNEGLTVMSEKLDGLGLDGARAVAVLSTLSANTKLVREQQVIANKAMDEGKSLTAEYEVKNNNLAGSWEKLTRRFKAFFVNTTAVRWLENVVTSLADTRSEAEKLMDEFDKGKSDLQNYEKNLIPLVERYEELQAKTKRNVSENEELEKTIAGIVGIMPSAVAEVDSYGKVLSLNTVQINKNIQSQRDLVEAMSSKAPSVLKNELKDLAYEAEVLNRRYTDGIKHRETISKGSGYTARRETVSVYKKESDEVLVDVNTKLIQINEKIRKTIDNLTLFAYKGVAGMNKLKEVVNSMHYKTVKYARHIKDSDISEGDVYLTQENIRKVLIKAIDTRIKETKLKEQAEKERKTIAQVKNFEDLKKYLESENALIRQMAQKRSDEMMKYLNSIVPKQIKIPDIIDEDEDWEKEGDKIINEIIRGYENGLKNLKSIDEYLNKTNAKLAKGREAQINAEIELIKSKYQKEIDLCKENEALQNGLQQEFAERRRSLNETRDEEIKAYKLSKEEEFEAKKRSIREKYDVLTSEELQAEEIGKLQEYHNNNLLSFEEFQIAKSNIEQYYRELNEKKALSSEKKKFNSFKTLLSESRVLTDTFSAYYENAKQNELAAAEGNEEKQKEIKKKYADKEFQIKAANIVANTALAVMSAYANIPEPITASIVAGLYTAQGLVQLKVAKDERERVKGLESGGYVDVAREQDGKPFRARKIKSKGGEYNSPTVLVGEGSGNDPEYVINAKTYKDPIVEDLVTNIISPIQSGEMPNFQQARKIIQGFEFGSPSVSKTEYEFSDIENGNDELVELLKKNNQKLDQLTEKISNLKINFPLTDFDREYQKYKEYLNKQKM